MKKNAFNILFFSFLLLFISCNDDEPTYEKKAIDNTELIEALKTKDFTFEGSLLVLNDKVAEVKSLDLSGSKLTDVSGLETFPNLEDINLSNNNFGTKFDFARLPKSIKKVNLSDNQIYDFQGLATVNFETADIKVLREFEHITLPASARFNMEVLPHYSKESKTTKLSMQNAKTGKAEPYTTLREIPDPELKKYFDEQFSSIITQEGKVDISKKISTEQASTDIVFWSLENITNLDGIEYIINNPFSKSTTIYINSGVEKSFTLKYMKPTESLELFSIVNINTPVLDWTRAKHLRGVIMVKNNALEEINMSYSKYFMQKEGGLLQTLKPDILIIYDCEKIAKIELPDTAPSPILSIDLMKLPELNSFDISKVNGLASMNLAELPKLKNLDLSSIIHTVERDGGVIDKEGSQIYLSITKDIMEIKGIKEFIVRFGKENKLTGWTSIESSFYEFGQPFENKAYDYTNLYKTSTRSTNLSINKKNNGLRSIEQFMEKFIGKQKTEK